MCLFKITLSFRQYTLGKNMHDDVGWDEVPRHLYLHNMCLVHNSDSTISTSRKQALEKPGALHFLCVHVVGMESCCKAQVTQMCVVCEELN